MRKITSMLLSICAIFCMTSIPISANTDRIYTINTYYNIQIDRSTKIDLYNEDEQIIAEFYELENVGYAIVDVNTDILTEFSIESDCHYFDDANGKYYYNGPLSCYKEISSNELTSSDGDVYTKDQLNYTLPRAEVSTRAIYDYKTSHTPRAYSYNPNGICGSTAAAMTLMYYNDYVNTNYVVSSLETSTGVSLIQYLVPYIDGSVPGSNYSDMVNGMNNYLASRGFSRSAYSMGWGSIFSRISSTNRPVIAGIASHPTYGNHWVSAYGYKQYTGNQSSSSYLIVSNGWGSTGVNISISYIDGAVSF